MIFWIKARSQWVLLSLALCAVLSSCNNDSTPQVESVDKVKKGSFTNPLFPNGADPWLEYWQGNYYLTTTTWTSELVMRKSPTLAGLAKATPINVWSATDPERCCNFWAFEFHRLKGPSGYRWYMMYTAGQDGTLDHQHLNVLESAGDDPMGPYEYKGAMMPNVWNIDGNYLQLKDKLYLIYSQWQGDEQRNLIAEMDTPWSLKPDTKHVVLTRPVLDWETSQRKVTEGAEILQHNGRTFMTYSGSFCDTPDYKLGLLELVGDDPMVATNWHKSEKPVFERTESVFGPGHNGFFTSPDGSEDWLVYHANDLETQGCGATRSLRAQKFTWNADGTPNFAKPVTPGVVVAPPSGEDGPLETKVEGQQYQVFNANAKNCLTAAKNGSAVLSACGVNTSDWVLDHTDSGYYRLASQNSGQFLGATDCSVSAESKSQLAPWHNESCQQWKITTADNGLATITNRATGKALAPANCDASDAVILQQSGECQQWQLLPIGDVAIISQQSGKALSTAQCTINEGDNIEQSSWSKQDCQLWNFAASEAGFVQLKPKNTEEYCAAITQNAMVPGANVSLANCTEKTTEWLLQPAVGGGFSLINRYTKQALNLANCGLADGTNIAQAPSMNNNCQIFHFREPE
jgi:GH43 family beta-xylosidase